ncbi:MAG: hypothetical protein P9L99_16025 [Candidatus Lernaella stagnicola]|nr:hypothetical protein [Candidatus Lernaella stagnicola]
MQARIIIGFLVLLAAMLVACGDNGVGIDVGFDDPVEEGVPPEAQGSATLENMHNHSGISVELAEIGISLVTDEKGEFALISELAEGEWTLFASYPFFSTAEQNFTVVKGRPENDLDPMKLDQRVIFDVRPERPYYTYGETVVITLDATNVSGEIQKLESLSSPMAAFAVRHNSETVVGGLFPGQGSEPQEVVLQPYETLSFTLSWTIDNFDLEPGDYDIYAVLTNSAQYPDYFSPDSELAAELNNSLFSKLTPATISLAE